MVNYGFYKEFYKGIIIKDEAQFDRLHVKALQVLRMYTFNRVDLVTSIALVKLIQLTTCQLVDRYGELEDSVNLVNSGVVKSASQGARSVTYESPSSVTSIGELNRELYVITSLGLQGTGLMNRGPGNHGIF